MSGPELDAGALRGTRVSIGIRIYARAAHLSQRARERSQRLADDDDGTELGDFDLEGEPAERAIGRRALNREAVEMRRPA